MVHLAGKVCIVTGATRGIGRGIALQLAESGAKVYITGRTLEPRKGSSLGGSLRETAREAEARGGTCVPIQCDHTSEKDVERLFEIVKNDNDGQLDILVNNAYAAINAIFSSLGTSFYEFPPTLWDDTNNVGLRNHYICSVYAARLMVPRKKGLIVNVSSVGGLQYLFNVPYGIGKDACDRMAADCGAELRKHNVAFVSLWPGPVATENVIDTIQTNIESGRNDDREVPKGYADKDMLPTFKICETTEFAGKCIAGLGSDPNIMAMSGKIVTTYDLGRKYKLQDAHGHVPIDMCSLKFALQHSGHTWLASITPNFLQVPKWLMWLSANRFY
ncbi:dehydrogenase/reductase SDR family member 1-like [Mya arenaria]|uniref:dehydrogenase/reductase SDR family member 1-like n=1 Tax=Mya arenaria TaxID=6604 RepID=UPI0022E7DE20|nr:dehydrogenase/reductase SDR family member 1-like [Mya arenaria]